MEQPFPLSTSRHLPAHWHRAARIRRPCLAGDASTRFAPSTRMKLFSRSGEKVAAVVGRVFSRMAAIIIGLVMMFLGLGMTATIVLLPAGIVIGLLGVAIYVGGLFAPDPRKPVGDQ